MVSRLKKLSLQFRKILKTSSALSRRYNYKIYLVGGVVRDLLLGKEVFDLDIVVEGDAIKLAAALSRKLKVELMRHHAFGTATINWQGHKIDFATARTEKYSRWGALPKVKPASLAEDLKRRDFTINAMAIGLNRSDYGKLIDWCGGLKDLKRGVIRILHSQSFLEDPTRIFRAIRFEQRFGFKIEPQTLSLLKQAINKKVLNLVNQHRLRNELILMLKEDKPYRYIKRVDKLVGFSFIDSKLKLRPRDFKLIQRIEKTLSQYQDNFKKTRKLEAWLVYLGGILVRFSLVKVRTILADFGFKKGERIIINSLCRDLSKIKKLEIVVSPKAIYRRLNHYSLEAILFFYAYYSKIRLRKNIAYFLDELIHSRIKLSGHDLKELGFEPSVIFGQALKELAYTKINKKLKTKSDEIKEIKRIVKRLSKKNKK